MKFFILFENESGQHEFATRAESKEQAKAKFKKETKRSKSNRIINILSKEERDVIINSKKENRSYYSSSACHIQAQRNGRKNTRAVALWG